MCVTDALNSNVQIFSAEGEYLRAFGGMAKENGELSKPEGIAIDRDGNTFVADYLSGYVNKFDPSGKRILRFASFGPKPGQTAESEFMDISPDNKRLYLAEAGNHRVSVFNVADGKFLFVFGGLGSADGQLNRPEAANCAANGDIYVADLANHRVQVFDSEGKFKFGWGSEGDADGDFRKPAGLAIDQRGNVYVSEIGNARVQKFTAKGRYLQTWYGADVGGFRNLHGVAVTADSELALLELGRKTQLVCPLMEKGHAPAICLVPLPGKTVLTL